MVKEDKKPKNNLKRTIIFVLFDILIVTVSFLVFIWIKPASKRIYLPTYLEPFLIFTAAWLVVSLIISKYNFKKVRRLIKMMLINTRQDFKNEIKESTMYKQFNKLIKGLRTIY